MTLQYVSKPPWFSFFPEIQTAGCNMPQVWNVHLSVAPEGSKEELPEYSRSWSHHQTLWDAAVLKERNTRAGEFARSGGSTPAWGLIVKHRVLTSPCHPCTSHKGAEPEIMVRSHCHNPLNRKLQALQHKTAEILCYGRCHLRKAPVLEQNEADPGSSPFNIKLRDENKSYIFYVFYAPPVCQTLQSALCKHYPFNPAASLLGSPRSPTVWRNLVRYLNWRRI